MTDGYDVENSALRSYAKAVDAAAERVERIRKRTSTIKISDNAFGKLPESSTLKNDYEEKKRDSSKDLSDAMDSLEAIAKGIRKSASDYDRNEDGQVVRFEGPTP